MAETDQPPLVQPSWRRALSWRQAGREADGIAQPIFEKLGSKAWVGQDEIDPPGQKRDVAGARERDALYFVLNILAQTKIVAFFRDHAPAAGGVVTPYSWFRLTRWGKFFRRWPASLRWIFLGLAWLVRVYGRQVSSIASVAVAIFKWWRREWVDVVLALTVLVTIFGLGAPTIPPGTTSVRDTDLT